jgi:PmbA protein
MELLDLAENALTLDGCDAVEVALSRSDTALTRYADSRVHQNVARVDGAARVRVVVDGNRVGVVTTNVLDPAAVREAAEQARTAAQHSPPDPHYAGMPAGGLAYAPAGRDDDETAACSPAERARIVTELLAALPEGVRGSGFVETGRIEQALANSLGVAVSHAGTQAAADVLASDTDSTGHAAAAGTRVSDVDGAQLGERAARKVELGRRPRAVDPGSWTVVLEPSASEVLVQFLAAMALGGKEYNDGRSALCGRLGEQVCAPSITIADDALSPLLPGVPFDAEGTPKRRTAFIDGGVAVAVAHDRSTGREAGTESTGHALPPPNPWGPYPMHLVMSGGDATIDDLVAGCERGLYITRFHYTNIVHPMQTTITGMTRDGTFLIEDGRITTGVRNMRFTQSVLAALAAVDGVGRDLDVSSDLFFGAAATPALRLADFTFTSGTAH